MRKKRKLLVSLLLSLLKINDRTSRHTAGRAKMDWNKPRNLHKYSIGDEVS